MHYYNCAFFLQNLYALLDCLGYRVHARAIMNTWKVRKCSLKVCGGDKAQEEITMTNKTNRGECVSYRGGLTSLTDNTN